MDDTIVQIVIKYRTYFMFRLVYILISIVLVIEILSGVVDLLFGIFLSAFKIFRWFIHRYHPYCEYKTNQHNHEQINSQHEQISEWVLVVDEDAGCTEGEE